MNEQMEREYRGALNGLRFSKETKERMANNLMEQRERKPAKRYGFRPLRAGIIAACLCLALAGTALAANPEAAAALIRQIKVQFFPSEQDGTHYQISGGMFNYAADDFSAALLDACTDEAVSLEFDTWEEMQTFLGEGVPCVRPEGWTGDCRMTLFQGRDGGPGGVSINSDAVWASLMIWIQVGSDGQDRDDVYPIGMYDLTFSEYEYLESYEMGNGLTAELVMRHGGGDLYHTCAGYFVRSGIFYQVKVIGWPGAEEETVLRLKTVLDSFG